MTKFKQFFKNLEQNPILPKLAFGFLMAMAIIAIILTIMVF